MTDDLQLFPALDAATEAALRSSIQRHGVLVPVAIDQHGRTLDGHHRARIAADLGIDYTVLVHEVTDDDHAAELARTLNLDRRFGDAEQRRQMAAELRADGHSLRAIGGALGASKSQIERDTGELSQAGQLPDRVIGLDGKSRPATRPARTVQPGDVVTDDSGEAHQVTEVENLDDTMVLHDRAGDALIVHGDHEVEVRPAITKPDLGDGVSHPARYSNALLPVFAQAVPVEEYPLVLDPFAGTGRIHELPNETVGVEIEPEWAALAEGTIVGSALELEFPDGHFDAVVTSPAYGNRLADHHEASDPDLRRSYTHDLGRELHPDNSGAMQWGPQYRDFHEKAWAEICRVLRPGGRLVLNIKDHVRGGERQHVASWHVMELVLVHGLELVWCQDVGTTLLRQGENASLRYPEQVFVLERVYP